MTFTPLVAAAQGAAETEDFTDDYKAARAIGKLRLGQERLYFRSGLKTFYIPYSQIDRYFRRIMQVPAKLCCGKGNFEVESLVICGSEGELAQIQMPGAKAGRAVMAELAELAPAAKVGPVKTAAQVGAESSVNTAEQIGSESSAKTAEQEETENE